MLLDVFSYRYDVLRELERTSSEANHAAAPLGLCHVDVVVWVRFESRVVHLRIGKSKEDSRTDGRKSSSHDIPTGNILLIKPGRIKTRQHK